MRIVVIGAGLAGMTSAFTLHERGHEVTVLDASDGPASGASFANGGMLHASQAFPWNTPGIALSALGMLFGRDAALKVRAGALLANPGWFTRFLTASRRDAFERHAAANARLARLSLSETARIGQLAGIAYDRAESGTLKVFRNPGAFDAARHAAARFAEAGVRFEALPAAACLARAPGLAPLGGEIAGGLWFPDDVSGDARRFCLGLSAYLADRGVTFAWGRRVSGFETGPAGSVRVVRAGRERFGADAVVLCAGAETPRLARLAGFAVDIVPIKGYSLTLDPAPAAALAGAPFIDETTHVAVCPLGGRLRVAGTAELAGYDWRLAPARLAQIGRYLSRLFPELDPAALERASPWAGLRPMTATGMPIIDRAPVPGMFLNAGHGHLGWTLAAGSAALLAALVDRDELPVAGAPFCYRGRARPGATQGRAATA